MSFSSICKGLAALAFVTLPSAVHAAYPSPGACTGECWTHDPAVFQSPDGTGYYRFSTGSLIGIYKAPAWEGPWTNEGSVIEGASIIELAGNNDLWAPDVQWSAADGCYYLYYSVSTFGSQNSAIGVANSTTLEPGSWTDLGATGVASVKNDPYNAIDANVFTAADGTSWMVFGSFWADIFQVELEGRTTKAGTPANIALNTSSSTQAVEAPFLFQFGAWHYLFTSSGSCCGYDDKMPPAGEEYKIMVCRSESVTGPFVDAEGQSCLSGGGTLVLESHGDVFGPGGQGVYWDSTKDAAVLYYHYVDINKGYRDADKLFGWNELDFSSGWPVAR